LVISFPEAFIRIVINSTLVIWSSGLKVLFLVVINHKSIDFLRYGIKKELEEISLNEICVFESRFILYNFRIKINASHLETELFTQKFQVSYHLEIELSLKYFVAWKNLEFFGIS
jgi:hypothetical protein